MPPRAPPTGRSHLGVRRNTPPGHPHRPLSLGGGKEHAARALLPTALTWGWGGTRRQGTLADRSHLGAGRDTPPGHPRRLFLYRGVAPLSQRKKEGSPTSPPFPGIFLEKATSGRLAGALGSYSSAVGGRGEKGRDRGAHPWRATRLLQRGERVGRQSASLETVRSTACFAARRLLAQRFVGRDNCRRTRVVRLHNEFLLFVVAQRLLAQSLLVRLSVGAIVVAAVAVGTTVAAAVAVVATMIGGTTVVGTIVVATTLVPSHKKRPTA